MFPTQINPISETPVDGVILRRYTGEGEAHGKRLSADGEMRGAL
jgi:hypothetical protein